MTVEPIPVAEQPGTVCTNEGAMTTSLAVAERFDKEHFIVLRDIRTLIKRHRDPSFCATHYVESSSVTGRGRVIPCLLLSEVAVSLLVMGYTGERRLLKKCAHAMNVMHQISTPLAEAS